MKQSVLALTLALAAANGANDVSKGVATLAGAGVTRYQRAVLWGAITTFVGALISSSFAERINILFSRGIVSAPPTESFAVAVLAGALSWVGVATVARLPVSTTHAIVGALIGAGIQLAPGAVKWSVLLTGVAVPLLASVIVSYVLSIILSLTSFGRPECICVGVAHTTWEVIDAAGTAMFTPAARLPMLTVATGKTEECRAHGFTVGRLRLTPTGVHWLTSGATGFARGLNDTPKIVAIGAFALVPTGTDVRWLTVAVALAMACAGLLFGVRVLRSLGEKVVRMSHTEGLRANLTTALLVAIGANLGLPMSTTHVASGAIAGLARGDVSRLNRRTLRDFALAWTVTPVIAGLVSAIVLKLGL